MEKRDGKASSRDSSKDYGRRRRNRSNRRTISGVQNTVRRPTILGSFTTVGFPDEYRCLLKYSMEESVSGTTGAIISQLFRANSLFDPDYTNTGHQPTYFDQLSLIYGRYYVKACRMRVMFVNTSATIPLMFSVSASDQSLAGLSNLDAVAEAPYSWTGIVSSISSTSRVIETPMIATSKIMGQVSTEPDDNMYAAVGANPADVWWFEIFCQSIDKSSTSFGYIRVVLEFECLFKDLGSPGESLLRYMEGLQNLKAHEKPKLPPRGPPGKQ